jgi:phage anti-repressor protein
MIIDYNMNTAYTWASHLSQVSPALPESLAEIKERAKFLDNLDKIICKHIEESQLREGNVSGQFSNFVNTRKLTLLVDITNTARKWFSEEISDDGIQSVCLRLWAGCLCAAKLVAHSTKSGPNTSQTRASGFANVDTLATQDRTFECGVEAAPDFKRLRNEEYSLDGVPPNSSVRKYA